MAEPKEKKLVSLREIAHTGAPVAESQVNVITRVTKDAVEYVTCIPHVMHLQAMLSGKKKLDGKPNFTVRKNVNTRFTVELTKEIVDALGLDPKDIGAKIVCQSGANVTPSKLSGLNIGVYETE